jgi:hypothetical protein
MGGQGRGVEALFWSRRFDVTVRGPVGHGLQSGQWRVDANLHKLNSISYPVGLHLMLSKQFPLHIRVTKVTITIICYGATPLDGVTCLCWYRDRHKDHRRAILESQMPSSGTTNSHNGALHVTVCI